MITSSQVYELDKQLGSDNVSGYDEFQGNQLPLWAMPTYSGISTNPSSGIYYNKSLNEIIIKQNGAVLNGCNLSGVIVEVDANNVTISNCTFNDKSGWFAIVQNSSWSGMTVKNCTFNGGDNVSLNCFITSQTYATISDNRFIDTPSHAVQVAAGVVSNNYFSGASYQAGAHADAICIYNTTGPVTITGNYIDWTNSADALGVTNNAIQIATDIGSISNVTVTNNIILGGQCSINVGYGSVSGASFSNVNIYNNFIGDYVYSAYYPTDPAGVTLGSYTDVGYDNPALSTAAWSAYLANGIVTNSLLTATASGTTLYATTTGSTTLYGGGISGVHLDGRSGETIYVGGAGTQYMWSGSGRDIYTYLALADSTVNSPDGIGNFNVATDVIDLHDLNAEPGSSPPVNFTFIGSAAFSSAGGEVRIVQDIAHNQTLVEADLVGDSSADLEIRISGLLNLTAANFALTNAQYEADIAPSTTVASFLTSQSLLDQVAGGYSIVDSLANIRTNLDALETDAAGDINTVTPTSGVISVNAVTFVADQAILNKFAGGFAVVDTGANIQAQIGALENDAGPITTVTMSDSTAASPDVLSLSAVSAASDAAILAKIAQPYVLDVTGSSGTTVTGHGSGLTLDVAAGDTMVTGGAKGDTFYFSAHFGATQITDFGQYEANATPDAISLSTTDFANWATLLADGHQSGANTVFTAADGASLTLDNVSLSGLQHASAALQAEFKFHP